MEHPIPRPVLKATVLQGLQGLVMGRVPELRGIHIQQPTEPAAMEPTESRSSPSSSNLHLEAL